MLREGCFRAGDGFDGHVGVVKSFDGLLNLEIGCMRAPGMQSFVGRVGQVRHKPTRSTLGDDLYFLQPS